MSGPFPSKEREEKELCRYVEYIHAKHKRHRLYRVYKYAAILILPLLVSIYWLQKEQTAENAADTEGTVLAEPYTLVVNRGDVCRIVCENLQANGVVDDAEAFRKFLGQKGFASSISVGSYSIPYGLDYEEIYQILKLGPQ